MNALVTTTAVALTPPRKRGQERVVVIQNLGPNPIYVDSTPQVTTATGVQIAASGGQLIIPVGVALWAICSALQVTPLDTLIISVGSIQ